MSIKLKQIILLTTFALLAPCVSHATINTPTNFLSLNTGLVGWWTLDGDSINWSTGQVSDLSGSGDTGQINNLPTSTSPVVGKIGQALFFNGNPSQPTWVDMGIKTPLELSATGTVSVWFRVPVTNAGTDGMLVGNGDMGADRNGYGILFCGLSCGTGELYFELNSGSTYSVITPSNNYGDGKWHLTTGTWDGTNMRLYVDGALIGGPTAQVTPVTNVFPFAIGRHPSGTSYVANLNGSLDDVRVYNRALSAAEVRQLYNATSGGRLNTSSTGPNNLNSSLAGWWTLDGNDTTWTSATAATTVDKSGNNNTGTLNGMNQATSPVKGEIGQALSFDGSTSYIDAGTGFASLTYPLTFSAWAKPTTLAQNSIILNFDVTGTNSDYAFGIYNTGNQILVGTSGYQYGLSGVSTYLTAGQWSHWVAVLTDSTHVAFYLNGVQKTLSNISQYYSVDGSKTTIGDRQGSPADKFFNGAIDDVRIYTRALSSTDVAQLYTLTSGGHMNTSSTGPNNLNSGLVGYWTFDGSDTTWTSSTVGTTVDISGNNNTGTLTNMNQATAPVAGKIGQAFKFDGSSGYVSAAAPSSISGNANMSICAWFKTTSLSAAQSIVAFGADSTDQTFSIHLNVVGSGTVSAEYNSDGYRSTAQNLFTANSWNFLCATKTPGYENTNTSLYLNGVAVPASGAGSVNPNIGTTATYIGRWINSAEFFSGSIDDVRVYNRALSASEVAQLYYMGK